MHLKMTSVFAVFQNRTQKSNLLFRLEKLPDEFLAVCKLNGEEPLVAIKNSNEESVARSERNVSPDQGESRRDWPLHEDQISI